MPMFENNHPTALVLGSAGFLGRSLVQYLRATKDYNVIQYDIRISPEYMDLRTSRIEFFGVDEVYLLAWDVGGAKYLHNPATQIAQLEWNVALLANTIPQLKAAKIPFLFVSSQLATDYSAYGIAKRLGEYWTDIAGGVSVRLSNIYGAEEVLNERTHVVGDFIHQALTTKRIEMLTDGSEQRYFLHIIDACRGISEAMKLYLRTPFDVAGSQLVSVLDIAAMIAEQTGAIIKPGAQSSKHSSAPSPNRLPGFYPGVDLYDGIAMTVDLYRE